MQSEPFNLRRTYWVPGHPHCYSTLDILFNFASTVFKFHDFVNEELCKVCIKFEEIILINKKNKQSTKTS